jgi:hypothetical protein
MKLFDSYRVYLHRKVNVETQFFIETPFLERKNNIFF